MLLGCFDSRLKLETGIQLGLGCSLGTLQRVKFFKKFGKKINNLRD